MVVDEGVVGLCDCLYHYCFSHVRMDVFKLLPSEEKADGLRLVLNYLFAASWGK